MGLPPDPVPSTSKLPKAADVVNVGSGIIGASADQFLAQQGVDVLLCKKGPITASSLAATRAGCAAWGATSTRPIPGREMSASAATASFTSCADEQKVAVPTRIGSVAPTITSSTRAHYPWRGTRLAPARLNQELSRRPLHGKRRPRRAPKSCSCDLPHCGPCRREDRPELRGAQHQSCRGAYWQHLDGKRPCPRRRSRRGWRYLVQLVFTVSEVEAAAARRSLLRAVHNPLRGPAGECHLGAELHLLQVRLDGGTPLRPAS